MLYHNSPYISSLYLSNTLFHTNLLSHQPVWKKKKKKNAEYHSRESLSPQNVRPRFLVSFSFSPSPPPPVVRLKVLIKLPSCALQRYSSAERAATANGANLTSDEDEKVRRNRRCNCDGGNYPRPFEKSRAAASFFLELLEDAWLTEVFPGSKFRFLSSLTMFSEVGRNRWTLEAKHPAFELWIFE